MLAIVAPGQGAQTPGFLRPWLELDAFATKLAEMSEVVELDLAGYGTTADADTIRDTAVAQPLLVAAALASALELTGDNELPFRGADMTAGHSVGELAAAAGAGALSSSDAIVLVRERGRAMARAAALRPTSMAAVVAGRPDEVLSRIAECGLTAANHNGPGQIVAAGTVEQIQALVDNPPARAKVVPLSVAGAFHTVHMEPAVAHLNEVATDITPTDPRIPLLSNKDGAVVHSGTDYLARLVGQVANPVRWDLCMQTMTSLGITGLLELPPAGTLTGIAKRALKGVEVFALNTPDQLGQARDFISAHSGLVPTLATEG